MKEAAARGAVMAGAEGEARLDLDADIVGVDARAVVRAMDEKAPGPHRSKTGERIGDPVALFSNPEGRGARGLLVRRDRHKRADRLLVGLETEIGFHEPRPAAAGPALLGLEHGRSRLGRLEALDDEVGDGARPPFVADQRQAMGGVVGRQAFEHGDLSLLPFTGEGIGGLPRVLAPGQRRQPHSPS